MNSVFYILIIGIFIIQFPFLKKVYLIDKDEFKIAKIINIIWCVLITWSISTESNNVFSIFKDFENFKLSYYIQVGVFENWVIFFSKLLQILLHSYLLLVVIFIVRRDSLYRKRLLLIIPFLFLTDFIEAYRIVYPIAIEQRSANQIFFTIFLVLIVPYILIYITYSSKSFRTMMKFDTKIIEKLTKNNNASL
jgi:hypothetical protein